MNHEDKESKTLKENLRQSADMLRAESHLAVNKYGQPILGLISLCYADIRYNTILVKQKDFLLPRLMSGNPEV